MKTVSLLILLLLSSFTLADDAAIERYVVTQIAVLEAQIDQLYDAIFILGNEDISQEEAFDKIGQPGFKAVDDALQNNGYSRSQFYQFADQHEKAIDDWLSRHQTFANLLNQHTTQRDSLIQDYDQLMKQITTAAN